LVALLTVLQTICDGSVVLSAILHAFMHVRVCAGSLIHQEERGIVIGETGLLDRRLMDLSPKEK